ncbi:hypothetical protein [Dickeya dadantii]|uniref:hypothetical protein n=1 Tax=Dickeya dadantii TaxID=204038 RepID=UPI0009811C3E|nr:hypothetical protein [Dickeya dadantii]NPE58558.1 hypothetical protein [Dickeya dadantii]NPE71569.1 hypothetical protein [Dickeya dadantii]OOC14950.1 hypothetical protein BM451_03620 [Dickeya dadantii]UAY98269.1 hypothetical protein KTF62_10660 [Dickeya dadantii]
MKPDHILTGFLPQYVINQITLKRLKNKELTQIKKHKKDKLRASTKKELRNPMFGRRFFFSPVIQRD